MWRLWGRPLWPVKKGEVVTYGSCIHCLRFALNIWLQLHLSSSLWHLFIHIWVRGSYFNVGLEWLGLNTYLLYWYGQFDKRQTHTQTYRQTDKQADKETDGQMERWTDRQTNKQTKRQRQRQWNRQNLRQTYKYAEKQAAIKQSDMVTDRQAWQIDRRRPTVRVQYNVFNSLQ